MLLTKKCYLLNSGNETIDSSTGTISWIFGSNGSRHDALKAAYAFFSLRYVLTAASPSSEIGRKEKCLAKPQKISGSFPVFLTIMYRFLWIEILSIFFTYFLTSKTVFAVFAIIQNNVMFQNEFVIASKSTGYSLTVIPNQISVMSSQIITVMGGWENFSWIKTNFSGISVPVKMAMVYDKAMTHVMQAINKHMLAIKYAIFAGICHTSLKEWPAQNTRALVSHLSFLD